jgi:hypothetical protein
MLKKTRKGFDWMLRILQEARARGDFPKYLEEPLAELLEDLGMNKKEGDT